MVGTGFFRGCRVVLLAATPDLDLAPLWVRTGGDGTAWGGTWEQTGSPGLAARHAATDQRSRSTSGSRARAAAARRRAEQRDTVRAALLLTARMDPADAQAAIELSAWRASVSRASPGADLAAKLAGRPSRPKPVAGPGALARQARWANVLLDSLICRQKLISHLHARQMADFAELSGCYPGLRENLAAEIAFGLGVAESTAGTYLAEATSTVSRLPETFAALEAGRITPVKAAVIRNHTAEIAADTARLVEHDVLPNAPRHTVPELREACSKAVIRRDPEGAEYRHAAAASERHMTRKHLPDGMAGLWVQSTAHDIATIWEALTALGQASRIPQDWRTIHGRRVDALVDLCADILDTGSWKNTPLKKTHRRRAHINVTVPFDALIGGTSPGYLHGYGPITAAQARNIAADGTLRRLVCDPVSGTLLDYGRQRYEPPESLKEFVIVRDQTCTAPGCRMPAWRSDIDHIEPFRPGHPDGGRTSADFLTAGCRHHHRAKDGGGFLLHRNEQTGSFEWTTTLDRTYSRPATEHWEPPPPPPETTGILTGKPAPTPTQTPQATNDFTDSDDPPF